MGNPDSTLQVRLSRMPREHGAGLPVQRITVFPEGLSPEPLPDTIAIWRYLTFAKFTSLLTEKSLWLPRVDLLGDPFEGSSPWLDVDRRTSSQLEAAADHEVALRAYRRWVAASCWCLLPAESDAMWRLYARNDDGIAIRTTIGTLIDQINPVITNLTAPAVAPAAVFAGAVCYADHQHSESIDSHPMLRFFLKRSAFAHEREYRLVAALPVLGDEEGVGDADEPSSQGLAFHIDPATLVEEVVVAPLAPDWYEAVVRSVVQAFAPTIPVRRSNLAELPRF